MIAIELDESKEGIEVFFDGQGIEEMIRYLQFIKSRNEHMHLVAGGELNEILINKDNEMVKHAKLIYLDD